MCAVLVSEENEEPIIIENKKSGDRRTLNTDPRTSTYETLNRGEKMRKILEVMRTFLSLAILIPVAP